MKLLYSIIAVCSSYIVSYSVCTGTCGSYSTVELENVVKQLKDELDLLKDEIESLKLLTREMNSVRLEYKRDILKH